MRIPTDSAKKLEFYSEISRQCLTTRNDRFDLYRQLRNYLLFGSADQGGCPYNKIASTVETLCSMIYAPESTRFSIHLGTTVPKDEIPKVPVLSAEINDQWRASGTHLRFGLGLTWSLAFGSMLFKTLWKRNAVRTFLVEPHQFGVLREDMVGLEDQEAFAHCYTMTRTQLESDLDGNPRRNEILGAAGKAGEANTPELSQSMQRLILGGPVGPITGSLAVGTGGGAVAGGMSGAERVSYDYAPKVEAELVDMVDLYVWDDAEDDYQIVTMASPNVIVYDRGWRTMGPRGVSPFTHLCPEGALYDYFWGASFVAKLCWLQDWRTHRVFQIKNILDKQEDPPMSGIGLGGIAEEKMLALRKAGGRLSVPTPGGKIEEHAPKMPENIFTELHEIDQMYADLAGIMGVLKGQGEPGVRSKGQADLLARLGSARPKARAVIVEEAAGALAGNMLLNIQENSKQRFTIEKPAQTGFIGKWWRAVTGDNAPITFIAEQFTKDYEVKVDSHSSSPIFVEDRKNDIMTLAEIHAVDREAVLDVFDPPNLPMLKENLKLIEAKEEEAARLQAQAEQGRVKPQ